MLGRAGQIRRLDLCPIDREYSNGRSHRVKHRHRRRTGAVLDVIADFDSYPEWASEFKAGKVKKVAVISRGRDGWADQVEFTLAGVFKDSYVLAYDWDVAEDRTGVVSWSLVRSPVSAQVLKALNGSYTLEVSGTGTAVTYRLSVDVKIPMFGMLKRKVETVIIHTALKELKKHVASRSLQGEGGVGRGGRGRGVGHPRVRRCNCSGSPLHCRPN